MNDPSTISLNDIITIKIFIRNLLYHRIFYNIEIIKIFYFIFMICKLFH